MTKPRHHAADGGLVQLCRGFGALAGNGLEAPKTKREGRTGSPGEGGRSGSGGAKPELGSKGKLSKGEL